MIKPSHDRDSRNLSSQRGTGDDTRSTDEGGTDVGQDVTVQVGAHDGVELLGLGNHLHRAIVVPQRSSSVSDASEGDRGAFGPTHVLSTIIESKAIPLFLYSLATSVQVLRKRPSPSCNIRARQGQTVVERRFNLLNALNDAPS